LSAPHSIVNVDPHVETSGTPARANTYVACPVVKPDLPNVYFTEIMYHPLKEVCLFATTLKSKIYLIISFRWATMMIMNTSSSTMVARKKSISYVFCCCVAHACSICCVWVGEFSIRGHVESRSCHIAENRCIVGAGRVRNHCKGKRKNKKTRVKPNNHMPIEICCNRTQLHLLNCILPVRRFFSWRVVVWEMAATSSRCSVN
jgi:hypothetical protein